ncbi:outer membrane lipoprotein carrier protein LolA [Azospira restricta]|uniref:Outer membrane lipoprotein carrier protein LolA n=1 Tax=Azospira restricta TaxID=404405 RepID=A0A974SQR5_9RHOO|nr:outer membrane lipoprotein carrier protein LolA [Azospira restricta]QRJ64752.1 outer membrane lipoprotein carrier protein LolA [Azospira restricta]
MNALRLCRSTLLSAVLLGLAAPALAARDLATLMHDLAQHKGGRVRFVEKKYIALLDKPLVSSGEMTYTAPDRLEKRTLQPKPEVLVLDRDTLTLERGKQKFVLRLADQPEAQVFVDSIRGTLAGNRALLERSYALHLSGTRERWSLSLLPSDQRIAALVSRITVGGTRHQVDSIEYLQADGDRAVMTITPIEAQ